MDIPHAFDAILVSNVAVHYTTMLVEFQLNLPVNFPENKMLPASWVYM